MFGNSLERLTEFRKAPYLWLLVYFKGCDSGTAKWKGGMGQGLLGRGTELPWPLWACAFQHIVLTRTEAPLASLTQSFYRSFIT